MLSRVFPIIRRCSSAASYVAPVTNSKIKLCKYPVVNQFTRCQNMSTVPDEILNEPSRNLDYSQLLEKKKDPNVVLIDVREPSEINETGKLPGSIHIPLNDVQNAFGNMSPQDFQNMYKTEKPNHDTQVIFSCRSGRRSKELGQALGEMSPEAFQKTYNARLPTKDKQIIFSCKAGGRSRRAMAQAYTLGFLNAAHYKGGWLDWAENTKTGQN